MKSISSKISLDSLGFTASFICAIHCASMPLLITALAISPLSFIVKPGFELSVIIFSVMIGITSLLPSYKNHHHKLLPIIILLVGFFLIFSGHFLVPGKFEPIVTPIGAFSVALAHLLNFNLVRKSHHGCNYHQHS